MKKIITALVLLSAIFYLEPSLTRAQEAPLSKEKVKALNDLSQKIEGTYQVQVINSRELPVMPLQLVEIVESKRAESDTTYYWLKPNIKVMILPKRVIQDPNFKKIEKITHVAN